MNDVVGSKTLDVMSQADNYNRLLFGLLKSYLHGDILEVGCGKGVFTRNLVAYGCVTAIDINSDYVEAVQQNLKSRASVGLGNVETGRYFFKKKKFDVIINLNVLEHIKKDQKALVNMYKLLKPNGRLILITPAHQINYTTFDKGLGHYRRYSAKGLKNKFLEAGFKVKKCYYLNWLGALGWFFSGKVLKKTVIPSGQLGLFDRFGIFFVKMEKLIKPPFGLSVFIVGEKK